MRKFEVVSDSFLKYDNHTIKMPIRATKTSVGYDFYSPIAAEIAPGESSLIWTNIKAQFNDDEGLILCVTSGMGKNNITLANAIGVIDSDYYSNVSNDGNIGFRLHNFGKNSYKIEIGDKIGQGIFIKYLTVDNETAPTQTRVGGFGSTVQK